MRAIQADCVWPDNRFLVILDPIEYGSGLLCVFVRFLVRSFDEIVCILIHNKIITACS